MYHPHLTEAEEVPAQAKRWACPFPSCTKDFVRSNNLSQHIFSVHGKEVAKRDASKDPREAILEAMVLVTKHKEALEEERKEKVHLENTIKLLQQQVEQITKLVPQEKMQFVKAILEHDPHRHIYPLSRTTSGPPPFEVSYIVQNKRRASTVFQSPTANAHPQQQQQEQPTWSEHPIKMSRYRDDDTIPNEDDTDFRIALQEKFGLQVRNTQEVPLLVTIKSEDKVLKEHIVKPKESTKIWCRPNNELEVFYVYAHLVPESDSTAPGSSEKDKPEPIFTQVIRCRLLETKE